MEQQLKGSNKPQHYAKITLSERIRLVELVFQKSLSITKAARKLSIKLSTAKLILKKFREQGAFFEKREDRINRLQAQKTANEIAPTSPIMEPPTIIQNIEANELPPEYAWSNGIYSPQANTFMVYGNMNGIANSPWGFYGNYGSIIYGNVPYYY